jgi:stage V sporulation protein B
VSKFAAQEPELARGVQRAGLRMQRVLGLAIAGAFIAAAPLVAWLLHDASKTVPLMLAGVIVGGYAFYAVFIGTANGLHHFGRQAGLSVIFAFVRAGALLGMAIAGFGVIGVIAGWVAAVAFILALAVVWVGLPGAASKARPVPVAPMVRFFVGVAVYLVLFNLLMFVDTFLLKRLVAEHYAAHTAELSAAMARALRWVPGATGYHVEVSDLADVQVAYYAAVQNLARLSYQVVLAATFVVFPLVSRSTFTEDREVTKRYVAITARYTLMAAAGIAVVMAANPGDVLGLVYAPDFVAAGGAALPLLALGNVAFSLIAVSGAILNGAGRTRVATLTAGVTLVVAVVGNFVAIPLAARHDAVLPVAAAVTGGAMLFGAIVCGWALRREFGAFVPVASVVRVAIATASAMAVGRVLPLHGKLMTLVEAGVVFAVFAIVLVVTRELGSADLAAIKAVRRKRAAAAG